MAEKPPKTEQAGYVPEKIEKGYVPVKEPAKPQPNPPKK